MKTENATSPQTEKEMRIVNAILAAMRGDKVMVVTNSGEMDASIHLCGIGELTYKIEESEPMETPLPISPEVWALLNEEWVYAAMDKSGKIYFYSDLPHTTYHGVWVQCTDDGESIMSPLKIDTYGVFWDRSLTVRPTK